MTPWLPVNRRTFFFGKDGYGYPERRFEEAVLIRR